jgi:hypothetical protein
MDEKEMMICPCCGQSRQLESMVCSCGARQVGAPLAPPEIRLPRLGPALVALAPPLLAVLVFGAFWIFGNDLKVGRVLLVEALGENTSFTRDWLRIDPNLPSYRIFAYDAYRLAFYLSVVLIPLSAIGLWLAQRARRLSQAQPTNVGGRRMAEASWALSLLLLVSVSASAISAIPSAIERGREKRLAATRASMYQLHEQLLRKYYREYGTYPQELTDLSRVSRTPVTGTDYWERVFNYAPVSVIAARGGPRGFSNYKLVSAGPDGEFGNEDDITMIDGVIVSTPSEPDLPTGWAAPTKPRP